jgi:hypothetical protein
MGAPALVQLLTDADPGLAVRAHRGRGRRRGVPATCVMATRGDCRQARRDRPYRSGRSPDWIKVKNPEHPGIARAALIVLSVTN